MKQTIIIAGCVVLAFLAGAAPKVEVRVVADKTNASYKVGERIRFGIGLFEDGNPVAGKRLTYTIIAASNADTIADFQIDSFTIGDRPARIDGRQASIVISTGGQHDVQAQVTYQTIGRQTKTIPLAGKQLRTVIEVK